VKQVQGLVLPILPSRIHRLGLDSAESPGELGKRRQAGPVRSLLREPDTPVELSFQPPLRIVVRATPILAIREQHDVVRRLGQLPPQLADPGDCLRLTHELGRDVTEKAMRFVNVPPEKSNDQHRDRSREQEPTQERNVPLLH
jgi:hypothetical protein